MTSPDAPAAIGPYSHAILHGDLLWCSGQVGLVPASGVLAAGIRGQTEQALRNLDAVCREAGCSLANALRCTVYLADLGHFAEVNAVYATWFTEPYPARACVQVARLPKDALVEIDAVVAR